MDEPYKKKGTQETAYQVSEFGDFPGGPVVKNLPSNAGAAGLIPGLERSPGEGNGNPLQYSCLENPLTEEPHG